MPQSSNRYFMGIDVGGTKTEVCILSLSSAHFENYIELYRGRGPTDRESTLESFLVRLNSLVQAALIQSKLTLDQIESIGVGLPGAINPVTQSMGQGSVPFFKNKNLPEIFKTALGFSGKIIFDNDANCFALAETYLGTGRKWAKENSVPMNQLCLIGVILGTGVGGGLVVNGRLLRGSRGGAGEIGHITLMEAGRACYCGKRGCAEQYLSGGAFQHFYSTRSSALESLSGQQIFDRAEAGDPLAIANIESYRDTLVAFLSNLSNLLDPHVIVLGGGMSTQPRIYPGISERLSQGCFLTENPPAVLPNSCGDSAGVFGAALLPIFISSEFNLENLS